MKLASALYKIAEFLALLAIATDFRRNGLNRFSLTFPSAEDANSFVAEMWRGRRVIFSGEFWFASIPRYKVYKKVFLAGIDDPSVDMDLLRENIRPPFSEPITGSRPFWWRDSRNELLIP